jgi:folate-binding protein YgfZ
LKQDSSSPYTAIRTGAAFAARADIGRLLVTGADRASYLQGILTNDIASLSAGHGCYSAMLTAQGRMITDMYVYETGDALWLQVPAEIAASVRDHLERFVFSEDVQIVDASASHAQIGVYGPHRGAIVDAIWREPSGIRIPSDQAFGISGDELIVAAADAAALEHRLADEGAVRTDVATLEVVRIESGVPRFGVDMTEQTIPLEAGIEDRAISRTKGCYVGQEVIVRVLDRGHGRVARRFVGFQLDAAAPVPAAGAIVRDDEREIGRVTSVAHSPSLDCPIALGYAHREFLAPGTVVTIDGIAATVAALPFVKP